MKASKGLGKVSELALRQRRQGLVQLLPPAGEVLRGSLDKPGQDGQSTNNPFVLL